MKQAGQFPAGLPSGKINVAVQRPTVNLKEAENVGEELAAVTRRTDTGNLFSRHATFGPKKVTHPGLETED